MVVSGARFLEYELDLCSIYDRLNVDLTVYRFYILVIG
jgi:hypothetical protein